MKAPLPIIFFLLFSFHVRAQVTTPANNANFGVDAELKANSLGGASSQTDDWFNDGSTGPGTFIIDTTGAAEIAARYAVDPAFRQLPFYRTMRFPSYYVLNNRLLIDGVLIRDYHGRDSTSFASGNKNAMSPQNWQTPVIQPVLDKNDIEDMYVHLRRAGPTSAYSLWLMGGVSIVGTSGARYFDFEMYQTDIYYERASRKFYNYGPDAGHTSWTLDASGNIVKPGDVIFTAEYSNASLDKIEARIWVHKNTLSITPATFDWVTDKVGGKTVYFFDGATASSDYGYAAIKPKTTGNFYTGMQSSNGTWAGPFKFLDASNNVRDNFISGEFMEFSVNLSMLGLDPVTMMGGSACGLPFRRLLAKTRTSNSFSAELQDFIGPFDFFMTPQVSAAAEAPILCTTSSLSKINVVNPYATSIYTWYTPDGNIITKTDSTSIYVNSPGTYIVKQQLLDGCGSYAADTVNIIYDANCVILDSKDIRLNGTVKEGKPSLSWSSIINDNTKYYEVQRSIDGKTFETIGVVKNSELGAKQKTYFYRDEDVPENAVQVSYRIKAVLKDGEFLSTSVLIRLPYSLKLSVYPNPVYQKMNLTILSEKPQKVEVSIVSAAGKTVYQQSLSVKKGENVLTLDRIVAWTPGMYIVRISSVTGVQWEKIVIQNNKL